MPRPNDFGITISADKRKPLTKFLPLHGLHDTAIHECLGTKPSGTIAAPTRYEIFQRIFQGNLGLRLPTDPGQQRGDGPKTWKLRFLLSTALTAERNDLINISQPFPQQHLGPRTQHRVYTTGGDIWAGVQYANQNCVLQTRIPEVVTYGPKPWNIGLVVCYSTTVPGWPAFGFPQSDTNSCLVAMRTTQLARRKNDGGDHRLNLMFGLVASEDAVEFHVLRNDDQVRSSPILLLTITDGLKKAWAFLRWTIHEISTRAPDRSDAIHPDGVQQSMNSLPLLKYSIGLFVLVHRAGSCGKELYI
ncbi:hypothetical protein BDW69DRAFT_184934 [Aspergillus filifer]